MNLPGCKIDLPTVTEKDEIDIGEFGLENNVDIIALSFTRTGNDIK
jgi:pyruvate kinase